MWCPHVTLAEGSLVQDVAAPRGTRLRRLVTVAALILALALSGAPPASACDWWWPCGERAYAARPVPWAYGYRTPPPRGSGWAYGYSNPARGWGDVYAAWPSTSIPPSRWYERTAPPVPNADAVGLTMPITSAQGLAEGGLPAKGPSLFGPNPPPAAWGYRYGRPAYGYTSAYGAPAYGYAPPGYYAPPPDTASWWVEPRRRR
jgi:hypothetical protein